MPTVCLELVGGWVGDSSDNYISAIQLCNLILYRILYWSYWCGSTPASTAFRKSVRFLHNKYIFNDKTHFPSWNLANVLSEDSETQEGDFKGLKYEKFPGGACLRVLRSFRKSASIYPRSVPALYSLRLLWLLGLSLSFFYTLEFWSPPAYPSYL